MTKVFGIVFAQTIVTTGFCYFCYSNEWIREFIVDMTALYFLAFGLSMIIMLIIICIPSMGRTVPTNYILLLGFTLCESYMVATICSFYTPASVLQAAIMACSLFGILVTYAMFTEGDLNYWGPIVSCMAGMSLIIVFIMIIFPVSEFLHLVICWVFLIFTCVYTIYDVYLIT